MAGEDNLFYKGVRNRYVYDLRRKFTNSKARAKTQDERKELKELRTEKNDLLERLFKGEEIEQSRLQEVNQQMQEINQNIKNKTASERNVSKELSKKVKEHDNAIITLLGIDEHTEVQPQVEKAVENNEPVQALEPAEGGTTTGVIGAKS